MSLGKTFKETPARSGVVVLVKTDMHDVVTSASINVMNCWAIPSSSVSTRNRWELGSTLTFLIFFVYFILLAELVYAMEPAVLPPQIEWLNALLEQDLFSRVRVLKGRDYYNLPPQNNPREYEGLVREHLAQAIDRPHRKKILKSEGVEIGILERKRILQNQLLVQMRNEKNILGILRDSTPNKLVPASLDWYIRAEAYDFLEEWMVRMGSLGNPLNQDLLERNLNVCIADLTQNGRKS
nr:hypothetical protein [Tanacetum cinerariifolium]